MDAHAQLNEDLRKACLEVLANCHPAARPLGSLRRRITKLGVIDAAYTDAQLESALAFLLDKNLVASDWDELGSTRYWRATADGLRAFERRS